MGALQSEKTQGTRLPVFHDLQHKATADDEAAVSDEGTPLLKAANM